MGKDFHRRKHPLCSPRTTFLGSVLLRWLFITVSLFVVFAIPETQNGAHVSPQPTLQGSFKSKDDASTLTNHGTDTSAGPNQHHLSSAEQQQHLDRPTTQGADSDKLTNQRLENDTLDTLTNRRLENDTLDTLTNRRLENDTLTNHRAESDTLTNRRAFRALLSSSTPQALVTVTRPKAQPLPSGADLDSSHTTSTPVFHEKVSVLPPTMEPPSGVSLPTPPSVDSPTQARTMLSLLKPLSGDSPTSPSQQVAINWTTPAWGKGSDISFTFHRIRQRSTPVTMMSSTLTVKNGRGFASSPLSVNLKPSSQNPSNGGRLPITDSVVTTDLPNELTTNNAGSLSSVSSEEDECVTTHVNVSLPATLKGNVSGTFDYWEECVSTKTWLINVPEGSGMVVEFEHVQMEASDSLRVYALHNRSLLKDFNVVDAEGLAPLLRNESKLLVIFETPSNDDYKVWRTSRFRLRYSAHPAADIPPYAYGEVLESVESDYTYYCDGFTNLPTAITCDGIRHCQHGEDEARCAYREEGCGDWFPYNNNCLKARFYRYQYRQAGHTTPTMPLQAEVQCSSMYGATLATLQEPGGTEIATELVRKSGFLNAVVGIRKVKPLTRSLRHLYRFLWQWGGQGGPIAYGQQALQRIGAMKECAIFNVTLDPVLEPLRCVLPRNPPQGFICMRPNPARPTSRTSLSGVTFTNASEILRHFPTKVCPDGSVVQTFHRCQWGEEEEEDDDDNNHERSFPNLPLFQCRYGRAVHYSLLCDGKDDCVDRTDEIRCRRPQFVPLLTSSFICRNFQAIPMSRRCDGTPDCFDESDEESCMSCGGEVMCLGVGCVPKAYTSFFDTCPVFPLTLDRPLVSYLPGTVNMDGTGMSRLDQVQGDCDEGFYLCKGGHCIPTFLLNNGERDCPQGEDEGIPVNNMTCPGYYRCHGVGSCVHPNYVCDGVYHCPDKDDEMFCQLTCPRDCRCEGHAYMCSKMIDPLENLHVRYLDLSYASDVTLDKMHVMEYLSFLNLSSCGLDNVTLVNMPQLHILDLSFNQLADIAFLVLQNLPRLEYLDLSNNPFMKALGSTFSTILNRGQLSNLKTLLMTNVGLEAIDDRALSPLVGLKHLDLRQNQLQKYDEGCLSGLRALEELHTDESKLCCGYFHPTLSRCHAPVDELSSCDDLLGEDFFRVFLWALSSLAIVGNVGVLVYRQFVGTKNPASASGVLVKNLCAADLLMGVYMLMIGIADAQLRGDYVAKETEWKSSPMCTAAGFLSFLSSEVSAFVVCLITLDRVLVICFPFRKGIHLTPRVTVIICSGVWIVGVILAAVPLLAGLEFYGQNGICVPLPITRQQFSGQSYAFGVFIVLNLVLFILIGVGQVFIYTAVQRASVAAGSQRRDRDMAIARRLFMIVLTDFCCWFPIGLMGLLAASGVPIPGVVNVWAAIFVLPLNSALNPFLYTLNGVLEKRRAKRAEETRRRMLLKLKAEIPKWQPASVSELVKMCVLSKVLDKDALTKLLALHADSTILGSAKEGVSQDVGAEHDSGELTQSTNVNDHDDIQTA